MNRIAIITNVIPSYRREFYKRVFELPDFEVTVFCQDKLRGMDLDLCHSEFKSKIFILNSFSLNKEKLAWQFLPVFTLLRNFDLFIFYGNPRIISSVIWSSIFRVLGKKVAIWGQAHTANANKTTEAIRLFWWNRFNNIFVYTDKEVKYLIDKGIRSKNIIGMNNGLDQDQIEKVKKSWNQQRLTSWIHSQGLANNVIFLSCARLENKNKFDQFIKILPMLIDKNPKILWCVIGTGKQEANLQGLASKLGVNENIRWLGSIYDEDELAPWFMSAFIMVHPGAIGLSLLHAFGYGLPVITHNSESDHMPEFAAFKSRVNGYLFNKDDVDDLKNLSLNVIDNSNNLSQMKINALNAARNEYNVKIMARRFKNFIGSI